MILVILVSQFCEAVSVLLICIVSLELIEEETDTLLLLMLGSLQKKDSGDSIEKLLFFLLNSLQEGLPTPVFEAFFEWDQEMNQMLYLTR